ncbi:MAG: glycosyltransferase involved in cell wall biosynthesis [Sphingobacteriales bacterium]|jgi:glycosyltransferase involved in cell wall biosynthesis
MDISVVIPLLNESESLPELHDWIMRVMEKEGFSYEILFIDDGSTDNSWEIIQGLKHKNANVRGVSFRRNYGKSPALNVAFRETKGDVVITMDADLQDSPEEIPGLYRRIKDDGLDLVSGWKQKRYDPITKTIPTKLFNAATRKMSGIELNDFNCGLKAYRADVVKSVEVYGEMHRYIPVLAKWAGFTKIGEQVVQHQARKYGTTKFGWNRFINGFLDLLTLFFVGKFGKKPMHFFGLIGVLMFIVGALVSAGLIAQKLIAIARSMPFRDITDQPLFYIALMLIIIGSQLFLTGFIAELISRNAQGRNDFHIREKLGLDN